MKYSLYHMFKKRGLKAKYSSNIDKTIPEYLSSYCLFVKYPF